MSIFDKYPYTDFHELNLDWIIKQIKEVTKEMNDFKVVNQIVWGGLHDPGKEYPRWCIVDTPTHEGYISIQPVPAGITIDNEDYWRQVANYSALYADFQNRIIALETVVGDSNSGLVKDVNDAKNEINILQDADTRRNYLLIADSYGMRSTSQPTWTEILTSIYSHCRHKSVSSIGFTTGSTNPEDANYNFNFIGQLREFYSELTPEERNEVTDIVVCGGWNDARNITMGRATASDIVNRIAEFASYVSENFPNAKAWIGFIAWQTIDCGQPETNLNDLATVQRLYEESVYDNLYHMPNVSCIMKMSGNFDFTFFHPNPQGSAVLAYGIHASLHGGYTFRYKRTLSASDYVVSTGASATFLRGSIVVENNICVLELFLTGVTKNASDEILKFNDNVLPGGGDGSIDVLSYTFTAGKGQYTVIKNRDLICYTSINNEGLIIKVTYNTKHLT